MAEIEVLLIDVKKIMIQKPYQIYPGIFVMAPLLKRKLGTT